MNAIIEPLGDQAGEPSLPPLVNWRGSPLPVASAIHRFVTYSFFSPTCLRWKTICEPSGEMRGEPTKTSRARSSRVTPDLFFRPRDPRAVVAAVWPFDRAAVVFERFFVGVAVAMKSSCRDGCERPSARVAGCIR